MAALDLTRPATVRAVARRFGLQPSRRLGQHFLVDRSVLDGVVAGLQMDASGAAIEVGCGIGTLTGALAAVAARVVAIDVDAACVSAARLTQRHHPNVQVVRADARHLAPEEFDIAPPWWAAGNLPYSLTGPLLTHVFSLAAPPVCAVFLVQREVAARLAAEPGGWSLATLTVRTLATVERLCDVPPDSFLPPPAVHSSLIRLRPKRSLDVEERATVLRLARGVFQQRRKTLRHGVARALSIPLAAADALLHGCGISAARRPGTLGLDEWTELARAVTRAGAAD